MPNIVLITLIKESWLDLKKKKLAHEECSAEAKAIFFLLQVLLENLEAFKHFLILFMGQCLLPCQ